MSKQIQVLLVEDSEDDALLLLRELKRGGYQVVYERVDTPEAMSAALDSRKWDIIIADYVMPHFSGLSALKLLRKKEIDLPFILVSGKIEEDIAVGSMKAGAQDFINKYNLTRLVPAIERELAEAQVRLKRKLAEEALRKSEEEIRSLNAELEKRVRERTVELEKKNEELERFNKVFVGRELRMIELKKQIKKLEKELEEIEKSYGQKEEKIGGTT